MEIERAHDLSPGLLRQRRNLMMASTVLIFLGLSQAELQSIQALGMHVTFGRPEAVVLGLVAVTGYFAYRYLLYLIQEPGLGLRGEFFRRLNEYAEPKILSLRDSQYPAGKGLHLQEQLGVRSKGLLSWSIMVPSAQNNLGEIVTGELVIHLRQLMPESIKAALLACLTRSYFTDYFFPFFLAGIGFGNSAWDFFIR